MKMSLMEAHLKPPTGIRIVQIVLGAIAIALSIAVIVNPGLGIGVLIFLLSVILLVVGFERVATAFARTLPKSVRVGNLVLGALTIAAGIVVIAFPLLAIGLLVALLSVGLLFLGIARIIHGVKAKNASKWSHMLLLDVGILSIAIAFMIIASPLLGIFLLTLMLAVNLMIIGIESVAYALAGHRFKTTTPTYGK
jgi:uncharacterized membrane protein HdeD (DUF308 family)